MSHLLEQVPDPRDPRGMRHRLAAVLAIGVSAMLAGARSFVAIGEWAADATSEALAALSVAGCPPDEATIRRLFARLDADLLDRLIGAWMFTRTRVIEARRVIAIDGKSVRGAKDPQGQIPHLVAAFDHAAGVVLGQVAVTAKSNEIPCVRELLGCFWAA